MNYRLLSRYEAAIFYFSQALIIDPYFAMAFFSRANCYQFCGDSFQAAVDYTSVLDVSLSLPSSSFLLFTPPLFSSLFLLLLSPFFFLSPIPFLMHVSLLSPFPFSSHSNPSFLHNSHFPKLPLPFPLPPSFALPFSTFPHPPIRIGVCSYFPKYKNENGNKILINNGWGNNIIIIQ